MLRKETAATLPRLLMAEMTVISFLNHVHPSRLALRQERRLLPNRTSPMVALPLQETPPDSGYVDSHLFEDADFDGAADKRSSSGSLCDPEPT